MIGAVYNCYNTGKIEAKQYNAGGINGAAGDTGLATSYTYNCYNLGQVVCPVNGGAITGLANANGGTSQDINCYTTNATASLLNAGQYSNNVWIDTERYPIFKWQIN